MRSRTLIAVPAAAGTALVLALGTGGAGASEGVHAAATTRLDLRANPDGDLKFNKKRLHAKHGKVVIRMHNPSVIEHGIAIEGHGVEKEGDEVEKGETSRVRAKLAPGKYTFYCPVGAHRQFGMKGKLIVE
jgi:plastocyanin